jgi:hypothetical protein
MSIPHELEQAMRDFENRHAWGQIQLDYQRGKVVLVRKQETIQTLENNRNGNTQK